MITFNNYQEFEKEAITNKEFPIKNFSKIGEEVIVNASPLETIVLFNLRGKKKTTNIIGTYDSLYILNNIIEINISNDLEHWQDITINDTYTFPSSGNWYVKYSFITENKIPAGFLNMCPDVKEVYLPKAIKKIGISSFTCPRLSFVKSFSSLIVKEVLPEGPFLMPVFYGVSKSCKFENV